MSSNPVPPVPLQTPFAADPKAQSASGVSLPWLSWLGLVRVGINRPTSIPGPYVGDLAAAAAGVEKGQPYYLPGSPAWVVVRIT